MLNKINIIPIITDHFGTLRVPRTGKVLLRDLVVFLGAPVVFGALVAWAFPSPPDSFLTLSITVHTLFIPLLVNVLFVIYGIQEKHDDEQSSKERKLLVELYKHLCYSVLVSFASVAITAFAQACVKPIFDLVDPSWTPTARTIASFLIYALIIHLFLTVLMIVRRTHTLLSAEFQE